MDKPSFEESLRALAARRRSGENHPAPEELVAYRAGDLTPEEDDRIQEHLTQCRDCARLLLDLAEFEELTPPPEELGPVDIRAEASWQRLRSRIKEEDEPEEEPSLVLQHRPRPPVPLWRNPVVPWALAAGLTVCVLWLGLRMGSLQSEIARISSPRLNVSFEDLAMGETRSVGGPETPVLHDGGVLIFSPSEEAAEYEVEVTSADGAPVIQPLRGPAVDDVLTLGIPPSLLPVGEYSARLYAIESGERRLLEEHAFRIAPAAP